MLREIMDITVMSAMNFHTLYIVRSLDLCSLSKRTFFSGFLTLKAKEIYAHVAKRENRRGKSAEAALKETENSTLARDNTSTTV